MSRLLTISENITNGDICTYLCSNAVSKQALFPNRAPSTNNVAATTIALVTDALRWEFNNGYEDDVHEDLRPVANYLYWLCANFNLQAEYIRNGGSGGGTVIPSGSTTRPVPLDFIVSSSSIIATGQSGLTIPTYVGWNLIFTRNNIDQSTVDRQDGSSYFSWNRTTGTFSCSPVAQADELFTLTPA